MNIMEIMARHSEIGQSSKIDLTKLVEMELNKAAAIEDQSEEQPEDKPEELSEDKSEDQPEEQSKEPSEDQSEDQPEEQSEEDERVIEAKTVESLKELGLASSLGFTQDQADAILASIDSIKEAQVIIGGDVAATADTDPVLTRRKHTF